MKTPKKRKVAYLKLAQPAVRKQELPVGFKPLCRIPDSVGGGWLAMAPVEKLAKMTPKFNPPGRTDLNDPSSGLRQLVKSIADHGLGQFPVVNDETVVEGNRRVRAALLLELSEIPVLYRKDATSGTYAELNATQRAHSPAQKVFTWLLDPSAVTYGMNRRIMKVVGEVGLSVVEQVTARRMNVLSLFYWATRAYDYCQPNPAMRRKFLVMAIRVQAKFNEQKAMRDWVEQKRSPVTLLNRVLAGKSIRCD
jgi:hypothetical protein